MVRILKSRTKTYEEMFDDECVIKLNKCCKVGEIINYRIILQTLIDEYYEKSMYVVAIRLKDIDVIETDTDLSSYGFVRIGNGKLWISK